MTQVIATTGTLVLASGATTNNTTGLISLPSVPGAHLQGFVVDMQLGSGGPCWAQIAFAVTPNGNVTLGTGWIRSGPVAGADCVTWTGDLALRSDNPKVFLYIRNDTGSTQTLAYGWTVEVP